MIELAGTRYYTVEETAEKLDVTVSYIRRLARDGRIEAEKMGNTTQAPWIIGEAEVQRIKEAREKGEHV